MNGSVQHLFEEFQASLGDRRTAYRGLPARAETSQAVAFPPFPENLSTGCARARACAEMGAREHLHKRRVSHNSRLHEMVRGARERGKFLPEEIEPLRELLCEILSEEDCAEWLGFNDLSRSDTLPPIRRLASFIREPGWNQEDNIRKLRLYRAAAFIDVFRPGVLDWRTPHDPHLDLVSEFIGVFTRPGTSAEEQADLIEDLSRPHVPLEAIVRTERGPRLKLSPSELRYVWETNDLSHEERAKAWDSRTPKPFQPFGRSNLEMCRDEKLKHRWRTAVNHQRDKAKALYGSDPGHGEGEAN